MNSSPAGNGFFARFSISQLWMGLIGLTLLMRLPAIIHPAAIDDEVIYSVVANEMVAGGLPYLDAIERKPPLLFWLFESIFELFGVYNWYALHFIGFLWILLSMYGLFLIGRDLFNWQTGWVAAMLYAIFQPWAYWKNIAFNGEVLMNLPIIWAIWLCIRPTASKWRLEVLIAGMFLCAGFLLKQPAAIAAIPLGLYFLLPAYAKKRQLPWAWGFGHASLLVVGFFGALALTAGMLYRQGILEEAYFWIFTHHDVPHGITDPVFWIRGGRIGIAYAAACFPLMLGAYWSIRNKEGLWQGKKPAFFVLWTSLIAALIGTSASGRFYPHYYIQLTPILGMLAAPIIAQLLSGKATADRWWLKERFWTGSLMVLAIGFTFSAAVGLWNHRQPEETGRYIKANSKVEDRIFVWGQHTRIYLDAQRRPASRFVACFPLTGYIFGSPLSWDPDHDTSDKIVEGAWPKLFEDFEKRPPVYFVDQDAARKTAKYPLSMFPDLETYVQQNYELVHKAPKSWIYKRKD
ncbi:MAG: glycosyltransferase family 39 protein [Bacteroidota bacterium]